MYFSVLSPCVLTTTIVWEHVLKQHCIRVCLGVPIPSVRIRPATWLHFMHEMAVPISQSPQRSWWSLVLVKMQWAAWLELQRVIVHAHVMYICKSQWPDTQPHPLSVVSAHPRNKTTRVLGYITHTDRWAITLTDVLYTGMNVGIVWATVVL